MTLGRSGPLKRTGGLKRGKPLARSAPLKKGRTPIAAFSEKREDARDERRALVAQVVAQQPRCLAGIYNICQGMTSEVNELKRRSQWAAGYLVRANTEGLCSACHHHVTTHPGKRGWAMRHGHQVSPDADTTDFTAGEYGLAAIARFLGYGCPPDCTIDHRKAS